MPRPLTESQWRTLLSFRVALRGFLAWSEQEASHVGLSATQHQLLVAIRGHPGPKGPTITDVASYLFIRHHSAVGLVERTAALGLVQRLGDEADHRLVRLALTPEGSSRLEAITAAHLQELRRLAPLLDALLAVGEE